MCVAQQQVPQFSTRTQRSENAIRKARYAKLFHKQLWRRRENTLLLIDMQGSCSPLPMSTHPEPYLARHLSIWQLSQKDTLSYHQFTLHSAPFLFAAFFSVQADQGTCGGPRAFPGLVRSSPCFPRTCPPSPPACSYSSQPSVWF